MEWVRQIGINTSLLIPYSLLLIPFLAAAGDCYTNLAGKVIAATPVKVERNAVWFVREVKSKSEKGKSTEVKIPLDVFPSGEQKRIKAAVGMREMPGELKGLAAEIASQRARYEARAKAGKLSQEKLAENLEMLAGSWRQAVEETNLSQDEKDYWMSEGLVKVKSKSEE